MNVGVRGDDTETLEWRLSRIQPDTLLHPHLVVISIGTNDFYVNKVPQYINSKVVYNDDYFNRQPLAVALRIVHLANLAKSKFPTSRVVIAGILPSGANFLNPRRIFTARVNNIVSACSEYADFKFVDPGPVLLDGNGQLSDTVAYDFLHPTLIGYDVLAKQLRPIVGRMLNE